MNVSQHAKHRQDEVGTRTREQHGDARERGAAVERAMLLARRHRAVALIEEAYIAAERDRGKDVLNLVRVAADAHEERLAESEREAQHLEPEPARDPEMPELVHRDEHAIATTNATSEVRMPRSCARRLPRARAPRVHARAPRRPPRAHPKGFEPGPPHAVATRSQ
jgi:hypothetical protein